MLYMIGGTLLAWFASIVFMLVSKADVAKNLTDAQVLLVAERMKTTSLVSAIDNRDDTIRGLRDLVSVRDAEITALKLTLTKYETAVDADNRAGG